MGFFDSLRRALGGNAHKKADPKISRAWGLEETELEPTTTGEPESFHAGEYDRKNWRKKLKRILDDLPESKSQWPDHIADAHSMGVPADLLKTWFREEFAMLVRRMVADRKVTEAEHRTLDLARTLLEIPDAEAESILHAVVGEAEIFFGGTIEGA